MTFILSFPKKTYLPPPNLFFAVFPWTLSILLTYFKNWMIKISLNVNISAINNQTNNKYKSQNPER